MNADERQGPRINADRSRRTSKLLVNAREEQL